MATYTRYGIALSLFEIGVGRAFAGNLLYRKDAEFSIRCADGSTAYFVGSGFVWDLATGKFTAGIVTAIRHYSGGSFNDSLLDIALAAGEVQRLFETSANADALRISLYSGNDTLDGRYRLGGDLSGVKLVGYNGNDTVYGGAGADLLGGENGDDMVYGGAGSDRIYGGNGNDEMKGGKDADSINAGGGNDVLDGVDGDDVLHGSSGSDIHIGGAGLDTAAYTRSFFDLIITPNASGFTVLEPNGTDTLTGIEQIACDEGVFVFDAVAQQWQMVADMPGELLLNPGTAILGSGEAETIDLGGKSQNIARGLGGNDILKGATGFDLLMGGEGDDQIFGDNGVVNGNLDRLYGESGNDNLHGGAGGDLLYGGAGVDIINGGNGSDELTGGMGADTFVFVWASATQTWGADLIRDFVLGEDHLLLLFANLPEGTLVTPSLTATAAGAVISLAGAGSILLKGVDATGHTLEEFLA